MSKYKQNIESMKIKAVPPMLVTPLAVGEDSRERGSPARGECVIIDRAHTSRDA
jgi:hypothetical protein